MLLDFQGLLESISGAGAVAFGFSESAAGVEVVNGSGAVAFGFTESASGSEQFSGTAAVSFAFAEAGSGALIEDITGTGDLTFGFSIAAGEVPFIARRTGGRRRVVLALPGAIDGEAAIAFGFALSAQGLVNDDDLVLLLAA